MTGARGTQRNDFPAVQVTRRGRLVTWKREYGGGQRTWKRENRVWEIRLQLLE